ncbi:hypothetical protein DF186_17175, partial [Enterococcus hirae]
GAEPLGGEHDLDRDLPRLARSRGGVADANRGAQGVVLPAEPQRRQRALGEPLLLRDGAVAAPVAQLATLSRLPHQLDADRVVLAVPAA